MRSSILIIYTGGTIGMQTDAETGALVPFDFSGIYEEFPSLRRLNVDIDVRTMDPVIDSSNVAPENWVALAELIRDNYARYDGFVVLHGTDTMSYTASALSFLFENLAKPVVSDPHDVRQNPPGRREADSGAQVVQVFPDQAV